MRTSFGLLSGRETVYDVLTLSVCQYTFRDNAKQNHEYLKLLEQIIGSVKI